MANHPDYRSNASGRSSYGSDDRSRARLSADGSGRSAGQRSAQASSRSPYRSSAFEPSGRGASSSPAGLSSFTQASTQRAAENAARSSALNAAQRSQGGGRVSMGRVSQSGEYQSHQDATREQVNREMPGRANAARQVSPRAARGNQQGRLDRLPQISGDARQPQPRVRASQQAASPERARSAAHTRQEAMGQTRVRSGRVQQPSCAAQNQRPQQQRPQQQRPQRTDTAAQDVRPSRNRQVVAEASFGRALPLFFVGLIAVLLVLFIVLPDHDFSDTENRKLQTLPAPSVSGYVDGSLQSDITSYVEDQFPLRDLWVTIRSAVATVLGRVENNGVYRGSNDTLIQEFVPPKNEAAGDAIVNFAATHPDIQVYSMIAPTAAGIWADRVPSHVVMPDQHAYLSSLGAKLTAGKVTNIDLWPVFEASKEEELYYRTDHHWTSLGAYSAYCQFAQAADLNYQAKTFDQLLMTEKFTGSLAAEGGYLLSKPDRLHVFIRSDKDVPCVVTYVDEKTKSSSPFVSSALDKRDAYQVFFGGNHALVQLDCYTERSKGTLLVVKDSYANCFIPFLIEDYEKILVVDPRYYTDDLNALIASNKVSATLFLYNATTFAQDTSLSRLVSAN